MIKFTKFYEQFANFYDDIGFMAALFYNDMLDNVDIYGVANNLMGKITDDNLVKIIANGADSDNNREFFKNYLNALGINFLDPKRPLIAKMFYYILNNKIDFDMGIKFVRFTISDDKNVTNYIGDDVGVEGIISDYYAINDRDVATDEKYRNRLKKRIIKEMRQYVKDNLMATHSA